MTQKQRKAMELALETFETDDWQKKLQAAINIRAAMDCLDRLAPFVHGVGKATLGELRAALTEPYYPLPDDLYPGSKDWVQGTYAERVEWLHTMYESAKRTLDALAEPQSDSTDDVAPEAPQPAKRVPLTDEEIDAISDDYRDWEHQQGAFRKFARAIEAAHGITGETK
jgi:hypothetical protein